MNKRTIIASLNKIANELDNNKLYTEANTVTKVMSRLAMDENDEYNMDEYLPDDERYFMEEDEKDEPSMYQELHGGFDEIQDMINPGSEYSTPSDLYDSYSEKTYDPLYPESKALQNVFSDLDRMLGNYMLSDKQKARYEQIKKRIMHISRSMN